MCVALPGRVIEIVDPEHRIVKVEIAGQVHDVSAALLEEDIEIGDWLELHMGFAMTKLSEEQARDMVAFMEELDAAHRGELEGLGLDPVDDEHEEPETDQGG